MENRGGWGYTCINKFWAPLQSGNKTQDVQLERADSTVQPKQGGTAKHSSESTCTVAEAQLPLHTSQETCHPQDPWLYLGLSGQQRRLALVHGLLCDAVVLGKPSTERGIKVSPTLTITEAHGFFALKPRPGILVWTFLQLFSLPTVHAVFRKLPLKSFQILC